MEQIIDKLDQHKESTEWTPMKLDSKMCAEVKRLSAPPALCKNVCFFVMLYLGHNQDDADDWNNVKKVMFAKPAETSKQLNKLDREKCYNASALKLLSKFVKDSDFNRDSMARVSSAMVPIAEWLLEVYHYHQ